MHVGSNTIPRPGNHLASRQYRFSYGHLVPLLGYPQPLWFQQASTFLCWCMALRQTPEHTRTKKKRAIKPKLCVAEVSF